MSEPLPPTDGLSDAELADQSVQREWDRYAMPDFSGDQETQHSPLAPTARSSTDAIVPTRFYDSSPAFDSTTALGEAFAKAQASDFTNEDDYAPHGHREDS
jgi:hypothetical protein